MRGESYPVSAIGLLLVLIEIWPSDKVAITLRVYRGEHNGAYGNLGKEEVVAAHYALTLPLAKFGKGVAQIAQDDLAAIADKPEDRCKKWAQAVETKPSWRKTHDTADTPEKLYGDALMPAQFCAR